MPLGPRFSSHAYAAGLERKPLNWRFRTCRPSRTRICIKWKLFRDVAFMDTVPVHLESFSNSIISIPKIDGRLRGSWKVASRILPRVYFPKVSDSYKALCFRCYEAHIPYTMQFFKDYILSGFAYVDIGDGKLQFRHLPKGSQSNEKNASVFSRYQHGPSVYCIESGRPCYLSKANQLRRGTRH